MTRYAQVWHDERLVDVEIQIDHMPRNNEPDDGPEWRIRSAFDAETNEPITLTDEQAELAFLRAIGVEEKICV